MNIDIVGYATFAVTTVDEWNALPQEDRDALIDAVIAEARSDAAADATAQQPAETVGA